jgi:hypothetical protein
MSRITSPSRIAARAPPSAAEPVRGPSGDERGGVLGLVPRTGIAHGGGLLPHGFDGVPPYCLDCLFTLGR